MPGIGLLGELLAARMTLSLLMLRFLFAHAHAQDDLEHIPCRLQSRIFFAQRTTFFFVIKCLLIGRIDKHRPTTQATVGLHDGWRHWYIGTNATYRPIL